MFRLNRTTELYNLLTERLNIVPIYITIQVYNF